MFNSSFSCRPAAARPPVITRRSWRTDTSPAVRPAQRRQRPWSRACSSCSGLRNAHGSSCRKPPCVRPRSGGPAVCEQSRSAPALRRSLAVGDIIAQGSKFCKPPLSKFVRARQNICYRTSGAPENPCNAPKMMGYLCRYMEKSRMNIWEGKRFRCRFCLPERGK